MKNEEATQAMLLILHSASFILLITSVPFVSFRVGSRLRGRGGRRGFTSGNPLLPCEGAGLAVIEFIGAHIVSVARIVELAVRAPDLD
jgi:hypothetical protein